MSFQKYLHISPSVEGLRLEGEVTMTPGADI